jgi:hypothetical protein
MHVPGAKSANRGNIHKGAFIASYGNSDLLDTSDKGDAPIKERKEAARKRRRGDALGGVCFACELSGHTMAKCYYAFPKKAFKGFKPRKHL